MTYTLFTLMPMFVIFFWLIIFFLDEKKNRVKRFLILGLSFTLVNYTSYWYYFNHIYELYHLLESIWIFTSLSIFPLYYYYTRLLTSDVNVNYRWSWILIPAFMISLFSAVIYLMMSPQEIEIFNNEILYHDRQPSGNYSPLIRLQIFRIKLYKLVYTIEVILTVLYGMRLIKKFNEKVTSYYSDIQNKELSNINRAFSIFIITALTSMVYNIIGKGFFVDNSYLIALHSITYSLAFFGICYVGYRQSFTISDLTKSQLRSDDKNYHEENVKIVISSIRQNELYNKMEYLVNEKQIFKNTEIRLNDLASMLGTNRTYTSQLIKNKSDSNFNDYINEHRIKYVISILSSPKKNHLTINEIALKAGFASQSSFYRIFLKMEGTSPAKYRMKQMERSDKLK